MIRPTRAWQALAVATASLVLTACGGNNTSGIEPETTAPRQRDERPGQG